MVINQKSRTQKEEGRAHNTRDFQRADVEAVCAKELNEEASKSVPTKAKCENLSVISLEVKEYIRQDKAKQIPQRFVKKSGMHDDGLKIGEQVVELHSPRQ